MLTSASPSLSALPHPLLLTNSTHMHTKKKHKALCDMIEKTTTKKNRKKKKAGKIKIRNRIKKKIPNT